MVIVTKTAILWLPTSGFATALEVENHQQGDIKEKKNSNGVISNSENY